MKIFSIKEAIKFGWETTKKNFLFILAILAVYGLVQAAPQLISGISSNLSKQLGNSQPGVASLVLLIVLIVTVLVVALRLIIDLGFIRVILNLHDNKDRKVSDLFSQTNLIWKYIGGSVLNSFIVTLGLILLIIPGIIFAIRFGYWNYLMVDKGLGPIAALQESWRITKGQAGKIFIFGIVLFFLNLGGALLLIVGLLATIPTSMIAQADVFRKLQAGNKTEGTISSKTIWILTILGILVLPAIIIISIIAYATINPIKTMNKNIPIPQNINVEPTTSAANPGVSNIKFN